MDMKFIFFILQLIAVLLEAKLYFWNYFYSKLIIDYLLLKDPYATRVRNLDEVKTEINNVTTLDFIGLVKRYNYTAEEHYVTTEDGYNLVIHRIRNSPLFNNQQLKKQVVFIQHGILCSSDSWVSIGAGKDFPFLLADQGYDVWLGNARGNSYSKSHVKLSPRDKNFWQFSIHETGIIDLPTMIDYVLHYTKQENLYYVGHSLGGANLYILLSMKPEYNAKIKFGLLLAPVGLAGDTISPVEINYNKVRTIKEFFYNNEMYEFCGLSSTRIRIGRKLCSNKTVLQTTCAEIYFLNGFNPAQLNRVALPDILSYFPAGTSVMTGIHLFQFFVSKQFQFYDYGYVDNYKKYKQVTPPTYDLTKVTAPLSLFYSANDLIVPKSGILETSKYLPNVILVEENPYKLFNHIDYLWAVDAKTLLYDRLIEVLQNFDTCKYVQTCPR